LPSAVLSSLCGPPTCIGRSPSSATASLRRRHQLIRRLLARVEARKRRPRRYSVINIGNRCAYVHRLDMETLLGCRLTRHEVVHHVDGDTLNNSPRNLELTSRRAHRIIHQLCHPLVAFCVCCGRPFLFRYRRARDVTQACSRSCGQSLRHAREEPARRPRSRPR
jgi:hypothetical protein